MDTIHIITGHNVLCHHTYIVAILIDTRIQNKQVVVSKTGIWFANGNVIIGQLMCGLGLGTERVDPCVQLHAALVALVDHPLQRVPIWVGRLALHTCQESAPRLDVTLVKRITLRANLEDYHIHAILLQLVELIGKRLLHLLCPHVQELSVNTLYPCATHLSLLSRSSNRHHHCDGHQNQFILHISVFSFLLLQVIQSAPAPAYIPRAGYRISHQVRAPPAPCRS